MQTRKQSVCVRHEDLIENTNSWLTDFQEQFKLETKPGFPIEVHSFSKCFITPLCMTPQVPCHKDLTHSCKVSTSCATCLANGMQSLKQGECTPFQTL